MKKTNIVCLIISLALPLAVGGISALLSRKGMADYGTMAKPPLSPPAWLFPVAWTILYLAMGFAAYLVCISEYDKHTKIMVMVLYYLQLAMNFMWSIVFFNWKQLLMAFIWLMVMWLLVIVCTICFRKINRMAALIMIPYVLWLTFAAYLNMGAYVLSTR